MCARTEKGTRWLPTSESEITKKVKRSPDIKRDSEGAREKVNGQLVGEADQALTCARERINKVAMHTCI